MRWCVGGDFHVIRRATKKSKGIGIFKSMKEFDSIIIECKLVSSSQKCVIYLVKLVNSSIYKVRFLFSSYWDINFTYNLQDNNPYWWRLIAFRFENMWVRHLDFKESIILWWRKLHIFQMRRSKDHTKALQQNWKYGIILLLEIQERGRIQ